MDYRLYKIRGRTAAGRRARLDATQRWMEDRGWYLVDFAEGSGRAMFERDAAPARMRLTDLNRWRLPPGYFSGLLEEWLLPRNLVISGTVLVIMIVVGQIAGSFGFEASAPGEPNLEDWWRVTADKLNIREEPLANSRIVGILHRDERVLVGYESDGWVEVIKPQRGFVASEYLAPGRAASPKDKPEGEEE